LHRRSLLWTVGSTLAAASMLLTSAAASNAATTSAAGTANHPPAGKLLEAGMYIVGFNATVAREHGYEIRTTAQGIEYSVKIGSLAWRNQAVPASDPVIYGNCGDSFMFYRAIGHRSTNPKYIASTDTGYNVNLPTVEGTWQATYYDNHGAGTVTQYNATNGTQNWSTEYNTLHSVKGYSWGEVDPNASWVLLDNGGLCYSGGPWESTTLD